MSGKARSGGPRPPITQPVAAKAPTATPGTGKLGAPDAEAAARVSPSRRAAFEVLEQVSRSSGHSDDLLHGPALAKLSSDDRNLANALVLGVLRWQIALDARVRPLLQRPDILPAEGVLIALRLGALQLLHMDRIPVHAAINESVELVRAAGHPHTTGMVNAILRKLVGAPVQGKRLHESTAAFAERLGHPAWLAERWAANYGRAAAMGICEFDQREPVCGALFPVGHAEAGGESGETVSSRTPGWPPLMDDGSRLVAELAAAAAPAAKRVWDCCAAPGGKAVVLAHRLPEADLLATDVNPRRLRALAGRLQREVAGRNARTVQADATALPASEGPFDLILCDVPCSGTGTLARNPEIRHRLQLADFRRQAERQGSILAEALTHLAPGGRLVYSTCSLEPEENEQVVAAVLAKGSGGVTRLPVEPLLESLVAGGVVTAGTDFGKTVRDGCLRTLPGYGFEGDGFFATVLQRE